MDVERPNLKLFALVVTLLLGACFAYQAGYRQGEAAGAADVDRRMNLKTGELLDALARETDADRSGGPPMTAATAN